MTDGGECQRLTQGRVETVWWAAPKVMKTAWWACATLITIGSADPWSLLNVYLNVWQTSWEKVIAWAMLLAWLLAVRSIHKAHFAHLYAGADAAPLVHGIDETIEAELLGQEWFHDGERVRCHITGFSFHVHNGKALRVVNIDEISYTGTVTLRYLTLPDTVTAILAAKYRGEIASLRAQVASGKQQLREAQAAVAVMKRRSDEAKRQVTTVESQGDVVEPRTPRSALKERDFDDTYYETVHEMTPRITSDPQFREKLTSIREERWANDAKRRAAAQRRGDDLADSRSVATRSSEIHGRVFKNSEAKEMAKAIESLKAQLDATHAAHENTERTLFTEFKEE